VERELENFLEIIEEGLFILFDSGRLGSLGSCQGGDRESGLAVTDKMSEEVCVNSVFPKLVWRCQKSFQVGPHLLLLLRIFLVSSF